MTALQRVSQITGAVANYALFAGAAVARVQAEVGSSNGDAGVQQSKFQTALSYVLAAAHAGEDVPVAKVQQIAQAVEFAVTLAKIFGKSGKVMAASTVTTITVPAAVPAGA